MAKLPKPQTMFYKTFFLILFFFIVTNQSNSQSQHTLKEINNVWTSFYKAFDSLDYSFMAKIHSRKLIRISAGQRISDYKTYINGYKSTFEKARENNISNSISLRFFERIYNDSVASERGIYKLTRIQNKEDAQTYYGQFHVLFAKENGTWKIIMDYDSNEGGSIGEKQYLEAHGIHEIDPFIKK